MIASVDGDEHMKGLWLEDGQVSFREDLPMPRVENGELLVRTLCAGICGTDLELLRGYYDFSGIAGHEFVGEVVGKGALAGQRIVADINIGCGQCTFCDRGLNNHCQNRKVIGIKNHGGAFAEFVAVPERNMFPVPMSLSNLEAVLVEPVAAALEVLEQVSSEDHSRVLVIGAGRLGILIATVLASAGLEVDIHVRNPTRLKYLKSSLINVISEISKCQYSLVVECSGQTSGFSSALEAVAPRGTIIMKSTYASSLNYDASYVVVNEISLIGSRCGPTDKAITWLQQNSLRHLEISSYGFEEAELAFQLARNPSIYKIVFTNNTSTD
jgi:threonine dehydrogenase-like Zn-dependent dehydrogenase